MTTGNTAHSFRFSDFYNYPYVTIFVQLKGPMNQGSFPMEAKKIRNLIPGHIHAVHSGLPSSYPGPFLNKNGKVSNYRIRFSKNNLYNLIIRK